MEPVTFDSAGCTQYKFIDQDNESKQSYDVTSSIVCIVLVDGLYNEYNQTYDITALFGLFSETKIKTLWDSGSMYVPFMTCKMIANLLKKEHICIQGQYIVTLNRVSE